jgi:hypothetical protein
LEIRINGRERAFRSRLISKLFRTGVVTEYLKLWAAACSEFLNISNHAGQSNRGIHVRPRASTIRVTTLQLIFDVPGYLFVVGPIFR